MSVGICEQNTVRNSIYFNLQKEKRCLYIAGQAFIKDLQQNNIAD